MIRSFFSKLLFGGGMVYELSKWIILAGIVIALVLRFWLSIFLVDGLSMEPNLHDKEVVLLKISNFEKKSPKRGDILAVKYPGDPEHKKYVKRVIGLPGEKLLIQDGKVYINDKALKENYLTFDVRTEPSKPAKTSWTLSDKEYFLMGDNRSFSNDSRYFGPVEKRFLMGQSIAVIFPRIHFVSQK